ncbi:MAG: acyl-homoserine-lactone synthase [Pseudomonadota bacterium]
MIAFTYGNNLNSHSTLAQSMFRDRAQQFSKRLGWSVTVNSNGEERDEYDQLNPLYVIVSDAFENHQGSMRFLPTIGRTMVNEHFLHVTDGVKIMSPYIWECTRFCISPAAERGTATLLMLAGAKLMQEASIEHFVGVFDRQMETVYKRIGASPTIVGRTSCANLDVGVGLWEYSNSQYQKLLSKSGLEEIELELALANSDLGSTVQSVEAQVDRIVA